MDLSRVGEGWNGKRGKFAPMSGLVERRAGEARRIIWGEVGGGKEGARVAVVAHGGVNHYFSEDWEGSSAGAGEFSSYLVLVLERMGGDCADGVYRYGLE